MTVKSVYTEQMKKLNELVHKMPWDNKEFYANWCTQTYYFVSHSTRLLALVSAHTVPSGSQGIHQRFLKHAMEESGHERLAQNDLIKLGYSLDDFVELTETKNFYQTQYYSIQHIHPTSFFGYILCLEGVAVEQAAYVANIAKKHHGKDVARFLDVHAGEDPDHLDKAFQSLNELNLDLQKQIISNFISSCENYGHIITRMMVNMRHNKISA